MKFVRGQRKWRGIFLAIAICFLGVQLEYNQGYAYLSYIQDARVYQGGAAEERPGEIRAVPFFKALDANDRNECLDSMNSRILSDITQVRRMGLFRWFGGALWVQIILAVLFQREKGRFDGRESPPASSLDEIIVYIHHQDGEKAAEILLSF